MKKRIFKTTDTSCRIGGPLSENFQGDLILLNNAVVGRINLDQLVPCTC